MINIRICVADFSIQSTDFEYDYNYEIYYAAWAEHM